MFDLLHLSASGFAAIFGIVVVGAIVQGAVGFGLNLLVVPVAAIVQPEALPAAMIIMALPMTAGSALREHDHIDRPGVLWTTLGRLPGVAIGAWLVSLLAADTLAIVVGGFVLVGALMSVVSPPLRIGRASSAAVGLVAGVMGTTSSIGGPPVALLYQNEPGPVVRSTLGAALLIGTSMSLAALILAGQVAAWHWALGLALMPGVGIGLYASAWLHDWLDAGWLRPCVLGLAALCGLGVLIHGLS